MLHNLRLVGNTLSKTRYLTKVGYRVCQFQKLLIETNSATAQ